MNIVQSFWTHPLSYHGASSSQPYCGGWLSEKHHAISWAFSLAQLRKFHPHLKIELLTDQAGYSWLINRIGLEYDEVKVEMDVLNKYENIFWCLGKVYAYSRQEEPFIHVDGDIYVWQALDRLMAGKKMLVQNFEVNHPMYRDALNDSIVSNITVPVALRHMLPEHMDIVSANLGVAGCNDMELVNDFCRVSFDFVNANRENIVHSYEKGNHNMLYEQLLFTQMAIQKYGSKEVIGTVIPDEYGQVAGLTRFGSVPQHVKYVHMIGVSKTLAIPANHLEYRFAYEYPRQYQHIRQLYPEPLEYFIINGLMPGVEGACPDFSKKEPLFASKLCLAGLHSDSGMPDVNETVIEEILEQQFDNPAYFMLWDIYQIESSIPGIDKLLAQMTGKKYWDILYQMDDEHFMNIPFRLNPDVCRIIYLYHNWEGGLYKNDISQVANGKLSLPVNPDHQPLPWLLIQTPELIILKRTNGWYAALRLMEKAPVCGEEIARLLTPALCSAEEKDKIWHDLVGFLSTQFHIHHLILPENVTSSIDETLNLSKQERCSKN